MNFPSGIAEHFLAQPPLGKNAVAVTHQGHSDEQFGINRKPCAYGSIRTPGLSKPCGSSSRLAARSAAAKSSGRCRSYQGL